MGDAAHPMMPDMAQGASQTFVDAFAIREAFAKADNVDQALMDFETNRRDVANAVVKISQKGTLSRSERRGSPRNTLPE